MISQEEIGLKSSRELRISPPKQRASVQALGAAPGGLIYDPASGSLRYPRFTQLPGGLKSEKLGANVAFPIHASGGGTVGKSSSCRIVGEKHSALLSAHGGLYDHQSAESSPRCVISNSILDSSTSTSPSGSKSMSEMDDYSDVKQLITHNRSSSLSDADEDPFYSTSTGRKKSPLKSFRQSSPLKGFRQSSPLKGFRQSSPLKGFRQLDSANGGGLENSVNQKNLKGNAYVVQKIYPVNGNHHSRNISTSSLSGVDSFPKSVGKDQLQQDDSDHESILVNDLGSIGAMLPGRNSVDSATMMDSGGGRGNMKAQSRGGNGTRSSQSHELLRVKDNGWAGENVEGNTIAATAAVKNSALDPILESLMKASVMKDGSQFRYQQNQIAEKIEDTKRKNGMMKSSVQSSSFSHGGPGAFSFNQTHIPRVSDADLLDYENNYDTISNSSFDFNRGGDIKGVHRTVLTNFTKPAPSKWDDAEKWLSSEPPVRTKTKSGSTGQGPLALSKKAAFLNQAGRLIPNITQFAKLAAISGSTPTNSGSEASSSAGDAMASNNDGEEVTMSDQDRSKSERTKKIDTSGKFFTTNEEGAVAANSRFVFMPATGSPPRPQTGSNPPGSLDRYPLDDVFGRDNGDAKEGSTSPNPSQLQLLDSALRTEKPTSDSPRKEDASSNLEVAIIDQSTSPPIDLAPKVCTRDMGTAMTPIASVEPSRAPTPVCARTPTMRSPSSSRPATPGRVALTSTPTSEAEKKAPYTDKELQSKTRQEILALGTQLGKRNIAAWATKEEEEEDASKSLKSHVGLEEVRKTMIATRAAAWEEAEQAKYMARFKREEAKILAWENHEKAKAEAEMRRVEMQIERMRSHANEKLMNKLAATRRSAEELRAVAAARRGEQASKTSQRAEHIRRTGKVPGSVFAGFCCS